MKKLNRVRKIISLGLFAYGVYTSAKRFGLIKSKQVA
jgi:hypothetical protein